MKILTPAVLFAAIALAFASPAFATALIDLDFNSNGSSTIANTGSRGGSATIYSGGSVTTGSPNSGLMNLSGASGSAGDYALNGKTVLSISGDSTTGSGATAYQSGLASIDVSDFTISMWTQGIYRTSYSQRLFEAYSGATAKISLTLTQYGFLSLSINGGAAITTAIASAYYNDASSTAWQYLAISFSSLGDGTNSQATVYFYNTSGLLTTTTFNFAGQFDPSAFTSYTVGNNLTDNRALTGNIDNFEFYDSALSSAEILAIRSAQAVPEPSATALAVAALIGTGVFLRRKRRNLSRRCLCACVILPLLALASSQAEQVKNGNFEAGVAPWIVQKPDDSNASVSIEQAGGKYAAKITVPEASRSNFGVQFLEEKIRLEPGNYRLTFRTRGSTASTIAVSLQLSRAPWTIYAKHEVELGEEWKNCSYDIVISEDVKSSRLIFGRLSQKAGEYWFSDVSLIKAAQ